mgnify:CR=1 FL=1
MNRALDDKKTALFIKAHAHRYKKSTLRRVLAMPTKERLAWIDTQGFTIEEQRKIEKKQLEEHAKALYSQASDLMDQIKQRIVSSRMFARGLLKSYKQEGASEAQQTYLHYQQYAETLGLTDHLESEWEKFTEYVKQKDKS